jgi:hypothetical protein
LSKAAELAPGTIRHGYVYAIALDSTGAQQQSRALLEKIHLHHSADRDILIAPLQVREMRETCQLLPDTRTNLQGSFQTTCKSECCSLI